MIRLHDWQELLGNFLETNATRPFEYGTFDCCLFVCDAIQIMTGIDPAASFRGKYSDRIGAKAILMERYGSNSVWDVAHGVTRQLELVECTPAFARRGDIVILPRTVDYSMGLIDLTGQIAVLTRNEGIIRLPHHMAQIGWHV